LAAGSDRAVLVENHRHRVPTELRRELRWPTHRRPFFLLDMDFLLYEVSVQRGMLNVDEVGRRLRSVVGDLKRARLGPRVYSEAMDATRRTLQILLTALCLIAVLAWPAQAGAEEGSEAGRHATETVRQTPRCTGGPCVTMAGSIRGGAGGRVRLTTNRGGVITVGISGFSFYSAKLQGGVTLSAGRMTPIRYRVTLAGGRVCPSGTKWVYVTRWNSIDANLPSCFS